MSWFTREAHKVASRVAASTDGEVWRRIQDDHRVRYERRKGVIFPDMDALGAVLEQFTTRNGDSVSARAVGGRSNFYEPDQVGDMVAKLAAPADRSSVEFTGYRRGAQTVSGDSQGPSISWTVTLRSTPGSSIELLPPSSDGRVFCEALIEIVERHALNASRGSTTKTAVVEPISLETASQRAHDAKVASKAARVGGWWGAVGGALVGGGITLFVSLVTAPGGGS